MVIYADILVILNFLIDFFLLSASGWILRRKIKTIRYIFGAFLGGIASLYIFLNINSLFVDFGFKLLICLVATAITFGARRFKPFVKAFLTVFTVTCGFAGVMTAFWHIFKPEGMFLKNSVVYFNISPVILICATVTAYLVFMVLSAIFRSSAVNCKRCEISLFAEDKNTVFSALVDSGNSISDGFGNSEIIIADKSVAHSLFGDVDTALSQELKTRYRIVPCGTVSGDDVLEGFRCDRAEVRCEERVILLEKPILAISKSTFNDDYYGVVNPQIFD